MPKAEAFTPKAIANRLKAKGLQKLRWYCQMCQKQCRDENGFKCHCESESHQRQMALFAACPGRFTSQYSSQFEKGFMDILSRMYRSRRVKAVRVYNEYISDRHHVHMNATCWETLTAFIKYLAQEGKILVEDTPKGFYITYIETDPNVLAKRSAMDEKEKMDVIDDTRNRKILQKRLEALKSMERHVSDDEDDDDDSDEEENEDPDEVDDDDDNDNGGGISMCFSLKPPEEKKAKVEQKAPEQKVPESKKAVPPPKVSNDDNENEEEEQQDNWVIEGIVVSVKEKELAGGKYYDKKGAVVRVEDKYVGVISILGEDGDFGKGDMLKLDQDDLETVIPKIGGTVIVLRGPHRGKKAILKAIHREDYSTQIELVDSHKVLDNVSYDDISKAQN